MTKPMSEHLEYVRIGDRCYVKEGEPLPPYLEATPNSKTTHKNFWISLIGDIKCNAESYQIVGWAARSD